VKKKVSIWQILGCPVRAHFKGGSESRKNAYGRGLKQNSLLREVTGNDAEEEVTTESAAQPKRKKKDPSNMTPEPSSRSTVGVGRRKFL